MKQKFLLSLLCLATLFVGFSCSDDDEDVRVLDPNDLMFKVQELAITANTYTFKVLSSDQETPYVCLYVSKDVIESVPREELHHFLMADVEKQAKEQNMTLEQYVASISHVGNMPKTTLQNLNANSLYELVVFGVDGAKPADKPFCHFFHTDLADMIEFPIEATYEAKVGKTRIFVKPQNLEQKFFSVVIPLKTYQEGKAMGMKDNDMIHVLFNNQLRSMLERLNNPTNEQLQMIFDQMLLKGEQTLTLGRGVVAGTEYAWLGAAMYVNEEFDYKFISDATVLQPIQTKPVPKIEGVTYDFQIKNERVNKVDLKLVPSHPELQYMWRFVPHNASTLNATPLEMAQNLVASIPPFFINGSLTKGEFKSSSYPIVPGMKHYLLAFGYKNGICTDVTMKDYNPIPMGDPTTVTFEVKQTSCTSDELQFQIIPSDPKVCYMPMVFPADVDKEVLKGQFISRLHRIVAETHKRPAMWGGNPYYTLWEEIVKKSSMGTDEFIASVKPGDKLNVLVITFNKSGIAGEQFFADFVTVPGLSQTVTVGDMEVFGIFDGDDEKGTIFGDSTASAGRALIAMKLKCSPDAAKAFSTVYHDEDAVDELDPEKLTDEDILNNQGMKWSALKINNPYTFLVADWESKHNIFSYGLSSKGERGKIARAKVPVATKADVKDITLLKELVDRLNAESKQARFEAPARMDWTPYMRTIDVDNYLGKSLNKQADGAQAEAIRVPYRATEATRCADADQANVCVMKYLPVAIPVR